MIVVQENISALTIIFQQVIDNIANDSSFSVDIG